MRTQPVVLVHGWAGSFATTWQSNGMAALLEDAGRQVIGVDLLGHGTAPKPHDPADYEDMTARIIDVLPDGEVDAIGFSLGAITLLELACKAPERIGRLVVAGIGDNLFRTERSTAMLDAVEGRAPADDIGAQIFAQYAAQGDNDRAALAAVLKRPNPRPVTRDELSRLTMPVLVVIGDKDFAGPGDPLAEAIPGAKLVTLRNVDHFATPESFGFIDAALEFVDALPA
jgi:pimeloyl-ACP methyl ester carboxylesterase